IGNQIDRTRLIRLSPSATAGAFAGHPFVDLGLRDGTRWRFGETDESSNRQNDKALAHALHSITCAALDSADTSLTSFSRPVGCSRYGHQPLHGALLLANST